MIVFICVVSIPAESAVLMEAVGRVKRIDWGCTIKIRNDCCFTKDGVKCCYPNYRGSDGYCYSK